MFCLIVFFEKRKHEHKEGKKAGNTKFKKAIMTFGFDNFKYKVLDKIDYSNDIKSS